MDILITRPASVGTFDVVTLERALKAACSKVRAVTVAHHCDPYAVFVNIADGEELTPEEHRGVEAAVQAARPPEPRSF